MTLLEEISPEILRESSTPVLETERLALRAPRLEDAKAIARLANDRRIAENTTRIPHPYRIADAEAFIGQVNAGDGELALLINPQPHNNRMSSSSSSSRNIRACWK